MENKQINRRQFLLASSGVAAATLISSVPAFAKEEVVKSNTNAKPSNLGTRKLGTLEVSSIGLGVQNMSRKYDTSTPYRPEMVNVIRSAYENGVTFFDAAEAYGPLEVERILGEAVAPFRDKIKIATKFGWNIDQETGKRLAGLNSRPEHIKIVVENMLKRLNTDRIDLLYQHRVDPAVPIEDVAGVVKELIKEGKVIHWGLSEMGLGTLRRAHKELPVSAVQSEYSMLWRGPENKVISTCEELDIGFVPWSPLGVQFLTGWIDANTKFAQGDFRSLESRFETENIIKNMPLVDLIKQWAKEKSATLAQIALAWLIAQKDFIVPIPGTTNKDHMLQNIGAVNVHFTNSELKELNESIAKIIIHGNRLPDFVQVYSDVEAPLKK